MNTKKEILPAVAAVIFNKKNELLLQKRHDVNKWCIISGHVEFGETVEEAILREIFEEANVNATLVRLIGVYSSPDSMTYHYPDRSVQYITTYFEARLPHNFDCKFTSDETSELRFFHPHEIPNNFAQINPYWLADALSGKTQTFIR